MLSRETPRELVEFAVGPVAGVDLGFAVDAVRDRTQSADLLVSQVSDQPGEPAGRHDGVVVQQDEDVAGRRGESLVVRLGEAEVFGVEEWADLRVLLGERAQVGGRGVRRAVVHGEDLEVCVVGVCQHALEGHAGEGEIVVRDDDDACARGRRVVVRHEGGDRPSQHGAQGRLGQLDGAA